MTCKEFCDILDEYVDGQLSREARADFDEHLLECEDCVQYPDTYRKTITIARASTHDADFVHQPIPEPVVRAVLHSIRMSARNGT